MSTGGPDGALIYSKSGKWSISSSPGGRWNIYSAVVQGRLFMFGGRSDSAVGGGNDIWELSINPTCISGYMISGSICSECVAGYYCQLVGGVVPCGSNNMYCPSGSTTPTPVTPIGYYTTGGTSINRTGQHVCPSGSMCINGYKVLCANGSTSPLQSSSCTTCSIGKYSIMGSQCKECGKGYYNDKTAATSCTTCSPGSYSDFTGAIKCSVCDVGRYAGAGGYSSCIRCPAGTSQSWRQSSSCSKCQRGTYSRHNGQTSCESCTTGRYFISTNKSCELCLINHYCPGDADGVIPCPKDKPNTTQRGGPCVNPSALHKTININTTTASTSLLFVVVAAVVVVVVCIIFAVIYRRQKQANQQVREQMQQQLTEQQQAEAERLLGSNAEHIIELHPWHIQYDDVQFGDLLGRGANGQVFQAKFRGSDCAVKTLLSFQSDALELFKNELMLMSQLRHPNILQMLGGYWDSPHFGIVVELCAKGELKQLLHNTSNDIVRVSMLRDHNEMRDLLG